MKKIFKFLIGFVLLAFAVSLIINLVVIAYGANNIKKQENLNEDYDYIIVLGTSVYGSQPSTLLQDRLDKAIELLKDNKATYIEMTGDGLDKYYNETRVMLNYAIENGVNPKVIYVDSTGLSTYESMYRAKYVLKAKHPIIITQRYHLYRSVFIAKCLGIDAVGIACDNNRYGNVIYRHVREYLARIKAFAYVLIKPQATYTFEEPINISEVK